MGMPTAEKNWEFSVNNMTGDLGSLLANRRRLLRTLVAQMISGSTFTTPWTVVGSSDSLTAALDSVNRWDSDADLVWNTAGSAHSWIVLKQAAIAANFQVLIALDAASATGHQLSIKFSPAAGFTGGSTTANPTATDSADVGAQPETFDGGDTSYTVGADNFILHLMISSDGECTRAVICKNGAATGWLLLDKPKAPVSGWADPALALKRDTEAGGLTYALLFASTIAQQAIRAAGAKRNCVLTTEGWTAGTVTGQTTVANELSAEWPVAPIGVFSDAVGARGRHCQVFDLWAASASLANGSTYPGDGSKEFVQFGALVFPWDGSVPVITG